MEIDRLVHDLYGLTEEEIALGNPGATTRAILTMEEPYARKVRQSREISIVSLIANRNDS